MKKSDIDFLRSEVARHPYLVHASNILTRIDKNDKPDILEQIVPSYLAYYKSNQVSGFDLPVVTKRVKALNAYYGVLHNLGLEGNKVYSAQTKFRPSVLEEFMALVFRDFLELKRQEIPAPKLSIGSVKAYSNLYFFGKDFASFARSPELGINVKDQDFAIFRKVALSLDENKPMVANLPVVAIECKTFIDKTMLEGSVATAEKLKAGNPYTFFGIVAETYDVSMDVNPAYSRIDQIYILRKTSRRGVQREIDPAVVLDLIANVKKHLEKPWSNIEQKLKSTGLLI
ncbi:MAG: Bpu10I family restriction endonuclease [Kiritimatiellae bacterium]|nr:Bpu10I family restriction endonuclease [Kiritimatiellia bacterium]